jgi:outer membrane immunogenic protein
MYRRLFFSAAALALGALGVASPAAAQDTSWTGWYVGGNAGGAWSDTSTGTIASSGGGAVVIPPADIAAISTLSHDSSNDSGFAGGIEGGYNWQSDWLLLGIETEYGWFNIEQNRSNNFQSGLLITPPVTATVRQTLSTDWVWTLRPRIGVVSGPWLFYGTAGVASTKINYEVAYSDTQATPRTATATANDTKTGWTAGLGAAYLFAPSWIIKGEWLYSDFGNVRASANTAGGYAQFTSEAEVKANLIRMGVDWKF